MEEGADRNRNVQRNNRGEDDHPKANNHGGLPSRLKCDGGDRIDLSMDIA